MITDSFSELYLVTRNTLIKKGNVVGSRIGETLEILGYNAVLTNPRKRLGYHPSRGFNLPFALAEVVCDVTGTNSVRWLSDFNKNIFKYSDDGIFFYGAYGPRIGPKLTKLIDELKQKKTSRRAVISVYTTSDLYVDTKDIPCTLTLQFILRQSELHMIVNMRSNDFFFGLPYDVFRFTMLQELVAHELGVDLGYYYHNAGSLHVYEWHYDMFEEIEDLEDVDMPELRLAITDYFEALFPKREYNANNVVANILDYARFYNRDNNVLPDWAKKFMVKE